MTRSDEYLLNELRSIQRSFISCSIGTSKNGVMIQLLNANDNNNITVEV